MRHGLQNDLAASERDASGSQAIAVPSGITFIAYCTPQPQGSARAFVRGGRAHITSANPKLKPFRSEMTRCAIAAMAEAGIEMPMAAKHVPVELYATFTFRKPESVKKRKHHVVKPDLDKLVRSVGDALTGVLYHDDSQVASSTAVKQYGLIECVEVSVTIL